MTRTFDTLLLAFCSLFVVLGSSIPEAKGEERTLLCHQPETEKQKEILVDSSNIQDHLAHGDFEGMCSPLQETFDFECGGSNEDYSRIYVRTSAYGRMDGTIENPFDSVAAALEFAEKESLSAIELQLAPGYYLEGALNLSRNIRIIGDGNAVGLSASIVNEGPFAFGAQGIMFLNSESGAALTVSNDSAETLLCETKFESQVGHAVSQSGGTLLAAFVQVNSTQKDTGDPARPGNGSAFILTGGVSAELYAVLLGFPLPEDIDQPPSNDLQALGNAGSGLYIEGDGSMVFLDSASAVEFTYSEIAGNRGCEGGIAVVNGASFRANATRLYWNSTYGVQASGLGTEAILRSIAVDRTIDEGECGESASSVMASDEADVHVTGGYWGGFLLTRSDHIGVIVKSGASVELVFGEVSENPIGASVDNGDGSNLYEENVLWINNDVNYDGETLPVPKPSVEWLCSDGLDNDDDGDIDLCDSDCGGPQPVCP